MPVVDGLAQDAAAAALKDAGLVLGTHHASGTIRTSPPAP